MSDAMTLARFKTIGPRDWTNGAVLDELYTAIKEREQFKAENERLRDELADFIWNGCFDGDCPHENLQECFAGVRNTALELRQTGTPNEE